MRIFLRKLTALAAAAALALSLCACAVLPTALVPQTEPTPTAAPAPEPLPIPNLESKYFLSQLSETELGLCTTIYAGLMAFSPEIDISAYNELDFERIKPLVYALFDDCPELYMCSGDYSIYRHNFGGYITFDYRMSEDEYFNAVRQVASLTTGWQADTANMSDYDKLLYVYDAIADRCSYYVDTELGDTAYGALIEGKALCQGYSKALQLVMHSLDIRCLFVSSEEMVHGWNIVELDGNFYQLDLTWDDSGDIGTYSYLNMSDELAAKLGHVYDRSEGWQYPECSSLEHNYYVMNGLFVPADADSRAVFTAGLDALYTAGGSRMTLMFDSAEQLDELVENQRDWIVDWNDDKNLTVSFTRIIPEHNKYVYICDFAFE